MAFSLHQVIDLVLEDLENMEKEVEQVYPPLAYILGPAGMVTSKLLLAHFDQLQAE